MLLRFSCVATLLVVSIPAQVTWNVTSSYSLPNIPIPPGVPILPTAAAAALTRCAEFDLLGLQVRFDLNDPNQTVTTNFDVSSLLSPSNAASAIDGRFPGVGVNLCQPSIVADLAHITGGISLYAFHIGPGGPNAVRAEATWTFTDQIVVERSGSGAATIELPLHIRGDCLAAEAWGWVPETRGHVSLGISGSVGGQSVSGMTVAVESTSIFPNTAAFDTSTAIPVVLGSSRQTVGISLTATVVAEAAAKGAGLFGTLSDSATVGVNLPGSIRVGNFTGSNGGPLPPDIRIYSAGNGVVFADTRGPRLIASPRTMSLASGGTYSLSVQGGAVQANRPYVVLGSLSGTSPGVQYAGHFLPLNPDAYTTWTLSQLAGVLSPTGQATQPIQVPPGLPSALIGLRVVHAYLLLPSPDWYASNAVQLDFVR